MLPSAFPLKSVVGKLQPANQIQLAPSFAFKVLLEPSPTHLFTHCLSVPIPADELSPWARDFQGPQSQKYLLCGPYRKSLQKPAPKEVKTKQTKTAKISSFLNLLKG